MLLCVKNVCDKVVRHILA